MRSHRSNGQLLNTIAKIASFYGGMIGGIFLGTTGVATGLHEVVGHGYLGFKTLYTYRPGSGPTYWVQGWDNFKKIKEGGFPAFIYWILGIPSDQNGASGWASPQLTRTTGLTSFGKSLSKEGRSVWESLSGSLPLLLLDGVTAAVGALLWGSKKSPKIGVALLGESIMLHLGTSLYPIDAAIKTPQKAAAELPGHDFANVALQLSHITHGSAEAIAISIATLWTLSVPTVALLVFLTARSHLINSISTTSALRYWVEKAQQDPDELKRFNELKSLYEQTTKQKISRNEDAFVDFLIFLEKHLPASVLRKTKKEMLNLHQGISSLDRGRKILIAASVISSLLFIVTKILSTLASWGMTQLSGAVAILTPLSILGSLVSLASVLYQGYQDYKNPQTPSSIHAINALRLVLTAISSAIAIAMLCVPGVNLVCIGLLLGLGIANILLNVGRSRIIIQKFKWAQAKDPATVKLMQRWLKWYQGKKCALPYRLKQWVKLMNSDTTTAHLTKIQTSFFGRIAQAL